MLFDLGWSEILLIGVVALVFIGPKDLPKAMRIAGYWIRKARNLSREFQGSIDQMIREAELDEVRQDLKKASEFDFDHEFRNTIDPSGSLAESLKPPGLPNFSEAERLPAPVAEGGGERAGEASAEVQAHAQAQLQLDPIPFEAEPAQLELPRLEPAPGDVARPMKMPPEPVLADPAVGEQASAAQTPAGPAAHDFVPPKP